MIHECERCGDAEDDEFLRHGHCETCWDDMNSAEQYMEAAQPAFPKWRNENDTRRHRERNQYSIQAGI